LPGAWFEIFMVLLRSSRPDNGLIADQQGSVTPQWEDNRSCVSGHERSGR
jgi:hypothetical protein